MSRRRSPLLVVLTPVAVFLAVQLVLGLLVVHPPAVGWIGLGVVTGALVGVVAVVFTGLFSNARVNAVRLHPRTGSVHRLLVVAEGEAARSELSAEVQERIVGGPYEVFVVAPVAVSPVRFLTEDQGESRARSGRRLAWTLAALRDAGIPAQGAVGTDEPLQAIGDALASFPADEILIVGGDESAGRWLEHRLERRARDLFGVPTSRMRRNIAA